MSSSPWAKVATWTKRLDRARALLQASPWAREVLTLYVSLLEFQKAVYGQSLANSNAAPLRQQFDLIAAQKHVPQLVALIRQSGPAMLKQQANEFSSFTPEQTLHVFESVLDNTHEFNAPYLLARMILQPMAERLAETSVEPPPSVAGNRCPRCQGEPQLAVIRAEGDGGKRSLLCSFCLAEWEYRRILCPVCGEHDNARLPRYNDENAPALRVEACDSCHSYLKSFDLTVDGLIVPIVDEIATAPLDLWAAEKGYQKIVPNVLGF